nr:MAG TPA: hypothetical protein [Caudoviricetes sp.]
MKFSIYRATDITDGRDSLFLVREDSKEAICIFYFDDCQIDHLRECAKNYENELWFSSYRLMHEPTLIETIEI